MRPVIEPMWHCYTEPFFSIDFFNFRLLKLLRNPVLEKFPVCFSFTLMLLPHLEHVTSDTSGHPMYVVFSILQATLCNTRWVSYHSIQF